MKRFAVLLLSLWARESFANDHECHYNVHLITDEFRKAVENISVPSIEYGDNLTEFKENYVDITLTYGRTLEDIIHARGQEIGQELINAVRTEFSELEKCIKSIRHSNEEPTCVELKLKLVTKLFRDFLDLIPGNALIKRRALPDLPLQTLEIRSATTKLEPADVFLNLAKNVNIEFNSFLGFVNEVYLTGWRTSREYFNTFQTQIRDEILNKLVLLVYREVVDKILKCRIEHHVQPETWESFKNACDRIIAISDDYKASPNNKNCA